MVCWQYEHTLQIILCWRCIKRRCVIRCWKVSSQLPRFLTASTDVKIRLHANMAPEFYDDPGNVNLDVSFYILCLREFMTPMSLEDILKLSWKEYGSRGERSSQGPMNFRGNVLEALMGYCHERSINVSGGYHAGRQKRPEPSSSFSG